MKQPSLVGPAILIVLLITLPIASVGDLIYEKIGWQSIWLIGASVIVGLETVALRMRMAAGLHEAAGGALRYLAAEIFGLVVLARMVATLGFGVDGITVMQAWIVDPLACLDMPFFLCLLTLTTVALLSRSGIAAIAVLVPNPPQKAPLYTLDALFYDSNARLRRWNAVQFIGNGVAWGGLFMIIMQNLRNHEGVLASGWMALYLIGGLSLFALAQQRAQIADWQSDGSEVAPDVVVRWRLLSIAIIGLIVLLALLMPVQIRIPILEEWRDVIYAILGIILLINLFFSTCFISLMSLIILLPLLLYFLLTWLLNTSSETEPLLPPEPVAIAHAARESQFWPGLIFWLCIALLALLAFWQILRRQTWVKHVLKRIIAGVLAWWSVARQRRFWRKLLLRPQRGNGAIRLARRRRTKVPLVDTVNACYHAALRHAAARGYPRRPSQTPAEYATHALSRLPDGVTELQVLTDTYQRVVYAGKSIDRKEQRLLRQVLRRFRQKV